MRPALALASRIVGTGLQFLVSLVVARLSGAEGVGTYFVFVYWTNLIATVVGFGAPVWALKAISHDPSVARATLSRGWRITLAGWLLSLPLAALSFVALPAAGGVTGGATIPLAFVGGLLMAHLKLQAEALKALGRPNAGLTIEFTVVPGGVLACCLVTWFARGGLEPLAAVAYFALSVATAGAVGAWLTRGAVGRLPRVKVRRPAVRELASFAGVQVLNAGFASAPYLVLPWLATAEVIGLFAIAHRLVAVTATFQAALGAIFSPRFATLATTRADGRISGLQREFLRSQAYTSMAYGPLFFVFIGMPGFVLSIFGAEFRAAVPLLVILAIGRAVNAVSGLGEQALIMSGREMVELSIAAVVLAAFFAISGAQAVGGAGIGAVAVSYAVCFAARGAASAAVVWSTAIRR